MKNIFIAIFFLTTLIRIDQNMVFKNGNIYYSNNRNLSGEQVRTALSKNHELLLFYNAGFSKSNIGGFSMGFGFSTIASDLVSERSPDVAYRRAPPYIGAIATVISIPVLIGRTKKIKNAVNGYNIAQKIQLAVI